MPDLDLYKVAEVQLVYKNSCKASKRPQVKRASDAYELLIRNWDENKIDFIEQSKVILLSRYNKVLGICEISSGGATGTVVDPKIVFIAALKANATGLILAHNHPSGNLKPSEQDKRLTEKIIEAGRLLDVTVADHIIVSSEGYYSFGEEVTYQFDNSGNLARVDYF